MTNSALNVLHSNRYIKKRVVTISNGVGSPTLLFALLIAAMFVFLFELIGIGFHIYALAQSWNSADILILISLTCLLPCISMTSYHTINVVVGTYEAEDELE